MLNVAMFGSGTRRVACANPISREIRAKSLGFRYSDTLQLGDEMTVLLGLRALNRFKSSSNVIRAKTNINKGQKDKQLKAVDIFNANLPESADFSCHVDANGINSGDEQISCSNRPIFFRTDCHQRRGANATTGVRARIGACGIGADGARIHAGWSIAGDHAGGQTDG